MKEGKTPTRVAIYTRVSTDDQSTKTQEHELRQYAKNRGWTLQRIYTDHGFSGALEKRPALDELLRDTRKRKFDVLLVWKFDRFARSLRQLVSALELFRKFGIDFVSPSTLVTVLDMTLRPSTSRTRRNLLRSRRRTLARPPRSTSARMSLRLQNRGARRIAFIGYLILVVSRRFSLSKAR
jgi:DNA invertase Pin-like site-specific DNA recombinase